MLHGQHVEFGQCGNIIWGKALENVIDEVIMPAHDNQTQVPAAFICFNDCSQTRQNLKGRDVKGWKLAFSVSVSLFCSEAWVWVGCLGIESLRIGLLYRAVWGGWSFLLQGIEHASTHSVNLVLNLLLFSSHEQACFRLQYWVPSIKESWSEESCIGESCIEVSSLAFALVAAVLAVVNFSSSLSLRTAEKEPYEHPLPAPFSIWSDLSTFLSDKWPGYMIPTAGLRLKVRKRTAVKTEGRSPLVAEELIAMHWSVLARHAPTQAWGRQNISARRPQAVFRTPVAKNLEFFG